MAGLRFNIDADFSKFDKLLKRIVEVRKEMDKLSLMFKTHYDEIIDRVEKLLEENKELQKELAKSKEENARNKFSTFISRAQDIAGGKLFVSKIEDFDSDAIKAGIEVLANNLGESVIVLANSRMVTAKVSDGKTAGSAPAGRRIGENVHRRLFPLF